jgi:hypothetical protein
VGGEILQGRGKSKIEVKWTNIGVQQLGVIQGKTAVAKSALILQLSL